MDHSAQARPASTSDGAAPSVSVGWIIFAATMLVLLGTFNLIEGFVALFHNAYYVVAAQHLLVFTMTQWGWVHLIIGGLAIIAGLALFTGATWARAVAAGIAAVNALSQLAFLSASPVWCMIVITLDILVIWAVVAHGRVTPTQPW